VASHARASGWHELRDGLLQVAPACSAACTPDKVVTARAAKWLLARDADRLRRMFESCGAALREVA
jgi:hypothetical protein